MSSLLDRADLEAVRRLAATIDHPAAPVIAALLAGGVLTEDPDDRMWPDRDRLVLGGQDLATAVEAAASFHAVAVAEEFALAAGLGQAESGRSEGAVHRVFVLFPARACSDGAAWEAALTAAQLGNDRLVAVVVGEGEVDVAAMLALAGWDVQAVAPRPEEVLGALDHLLRAPVGPGAVVVG